MSGRKGLPAVWRDAIGDSDLDRTAKLIAYALSTWMNAAGVCYPGRVAIARRASSGLTTVERAIDRLESSDWLRVERSDGGRGRTNTYTARLPETASERRRLEWEKASTATVNGVADDAKRRHRDARKQLKAAESAAPTAVAALSGSAASGSEREEFSPEDDCQGCGVRASLVGPDFRYCGDCFAAISAVAAERGAT